LLTVFISVAALAQQKPSFSAGAGITYSKISGDAMNSMKDLLDFTDGMITANSTTGFFAGGAVTIPLTETFSIMPGLYYTQKGYELRGDLNIKGMEFIGANAKAQLKTQYIDLPVLANVKVGGLQLFAGPQLSYLSKANLNMKAGVLGFNVFNRKVDATEQLNRWDAGITGGIGYTFNNGLKLNACYDHGLTKTDADKNFDAYNRSFKIGLGFAF